jgi:N-acetylmuramoyl-L-alanine amidase
MSVSILAVAIVLAVTPLCAQDSVTIGEITGDAGVRLQWDPYRGHGVFSRGGESLSFSIGSGIVLHNFDTVYRVPDVRTEGGTIIFPREFRTLARTVFPPTETLRRVRAIYIDPGHGGRDPGAIGRHTVGEEQLTMNEKDVVLSVSSVLAEMLRARYPDKQIVLSRDDDTYLTLEERTRRANEIETAANEAVVFVSVHANASLNRNAQGFEVWYLPSDVRRDGLVTAEQVGVDDPDLVEILNTMREEEITLESVLLARNVLAGMDARIGALSPNRGLREESWYVVRNAKMPSVLIEIGFITNQDEFLRLREEPYLLELARGIYTGIENFIRSFEGLTVD